MPLVRNRIGLREAGFEFQFFSQAESALTDCELLIVNGRYFDFRRISEPGSVLEELKSWSAQAGALIYYDMYDSSGLIHAEVIPHVDLYVKSYLLRDRQKYRAAMYGGRIYSDWIHRCANINDSDPVFSEPIPEQSDLDKLRVGWNMAYAHYGPLVSRIASLYPRVPLKILLAGTARFFAPGTNRHILTSARIATNYHRETIAYQRRRICDLLGGKVKTGRISKSRYFNELRNSKVVISPFGWGEYAMRDYEAFIGGALLLKPDMSHLETYPALYRDGETMIAHRWDAEDLLERLDAIHSNYQEFLDIAKCGQETYRMHVTSREGADRFVRHYSGIVSDAIHSRSSSAG